jgi:hypothetical protein
MERRLLGLLLIVGCAAGRGADPDPQATTDRSAGDRPAECDWQPTVTVHVDNRSSTDVRLSFGPYSPARLAAGFSRTSYRVARTYLRNAIRIRIALGGLSDEQPALIPTEPVLCNVATLIIGPRPRYSTFYGGEPLGGSGGESRTRAAAQAVPVSVDSLGVMRWTANGREVALFGVNYSIPFAYAYRAHGYMGVDRKQSIDADLLHLARLGLDAWRIHVWDREVTDPEGNLIENDHLDLLDYLLDRLSAHGIKVILTPIAWWGTGYPEPDPETNGLSDGHSKGEMTTRAETRPAQQNYLSQFVTHTNPYSGLTYTEDPNILAIEIFNEPSHPGSPAETTDYISAMAGALRSAGFAKPIFYNISQDYTDEHGHAVCAADIDGVSHQWYPTGLVRNSTVGGDMLPNVERYTVPYADFPECRDKARMVYEFDAADVAGSYMYPAMARSFRGAGFQWATQFAYDPLAIAYANTEYQTHFLNLVYTPGKAISFMIAGEAFRRTPRGASYGRHPHSDRFGPFRVSYVEDLSELSDDTVFYYSNDTGTSPRAPEALRHVAGVGSSPLVAYDGSGAYFLDRLDAGVWRLEVYPDVAWVVDPFTRPSLDREAARVVWRTRRMRIALPDLAPGYSASAIDDGNGHQPVTDGQTIDVRPGVYLLTRTGVARPAWSPETVVGGRRLDAFIAPPSSDAATAVVHQPAAELSAGRAVTVSASVVSAEPVDSVVLDLRTASDAGDPVRIGMQADDTFGYSAVVPGARVLEGGIEYSISVYESGGVRTWPGTAATAIPGRSMWHVSVVAAGSPIVLFDGARDAGHVLYPHPWEYVPFRTDIRTGSGPDGQALSAVVEDLGPAPHHFALRTFLPATRRTRLEEGRPGAVLRITARASGRASDRFQLALTERDGIAWGAVIELTDTWREIVVPLSDLRLVPLALLPRPYPQFLPYLRDSVTDRTLPRLIELDGLQFAIGADLFGVADRGGPHGFEIERVVLDVQR